MGLPRLFKLLDIFGGKSKFKAPRAFKFGTKWVPLEVNNWWKFCVDISNHFWEIEILKFFVFQVSPTTYENSFWKLFSFQIGGKFRPKKFQFSISQKWFEISAPNFHHLLTSIGTRFVPNMKALWAKNLNFQPKTSKTSNERGRPIFWATPFNFGENSFLP